MSVRQRPTARETQRHELRRIARLKPVVHLQYRPSDVGGRHCRVSLLIRFKVQGVYAGQPECTVHSSDDVEEHVDNTALSTSDVNTKKRRDSWPSSSDSLPLSESLRYFRLDNILQLLLHRPTIRLC